MLAFIEVEMPNPKALSKIRNYFQKWRPMRLRCRSNELEALGVPRGPKFDKMLEQLFEMQLRGKARNSRRPHQNASPACRDQGRAKEKAGEAQEKRKGGPTEAPAAGVGRESSLKKPARPALGRSYARESLAARTAGAKAAFAVRRCGDRRESAGEARWAKRGAEHEEACIAARKRGGKAKKARR